MSKKTFYYNANLTNFFCKKFLLLHMYPKAVIRFSNNSQKHLIFFFDFDFNESLSNTFLLRSNYLSGFYIFFRKKLFKHNFSKGFCFNSFFYFNNTHEKKKHANRLLFSLAGVLNPSLRTFYGIIFICPKKGGFFGYLNDFLGFIPESQLKMTYKNILYDDNCFINSSVHSIYFFMKKKSIFFSFKVNYMAGSLILYPYTRPLLFSSQSLSTSILSNKLNFVFLYKKL